MQAAVEPIMTAMGTDAGMASIALAVAVMLLVRRGTQRRRHTD